MKLVLSQVSLILEEKEQTFILTFAIRCQLETKLKTYSYQRHRILKITLKLQILLLASHLKQH